MARDYLFTFGSGNPSSRASLAPTFISFVNASGQTLAAPSVTETYAGTGFYKVNYGSTVPVFFVMDGATTGLAASERYISGMFDPYDQFGQTLSAMAASLVVLGTTLSAVAGQVGGIGTTLAYIDGNILASGASLSSLIGNSSSSFGSTSTDPTTLFGFMKRAQEFWEGDSTYTKATGILDFYNRGSSTLLREKTISDSVSTTTKT